MALLRGTENYSLSMHPTCSALGSHTIYAKILCPRWTVPISRLLTEMTGLERVPAALLASRYLVTQQTNNGSAKKDLDGPIEPVVIKPAVKRPEMNDVCQWMMTAGRMGGRCPFRRTWTGSS
ncbi:uncharacterized protein LOC119765023 [Culex quinquefasciatus]|uniref:uncharacterized protein LOC119765023 n=1 Tax=Culex quinquefasciatus TaxID=7176 RepID=UPI0018E3E1DF|nr:uncharacterized protein LOC119765023 [Culex quinquefasciatus]